MRFLFVFSNTATTEISTLSLHDALPISGGPPGKRAAGVGAQPCCAPTAAAYFDATFTSICRGLDRKSTRLNSSHVEISYAVFCLKKKTQRHASIPSCKSTRATE